MKKDIDNIIKESLRAGDKDKLNLFRVLKGEHPFKDVWAPKAPPRNPLGRNCMEPTEKITRNPNIRPTHPPSYKNKQLVSFLLNSRIVLPPKIVPRAFLGGKNGWDRRRKKQDRRPNIVDNT